MVYAKKPEKLDKGTWWASIVAIGHHTGEKHASRWTCEMSDCRSDKYVEVAESIAREAALVWYDDTNQSGDAEVDVLVEGWEGRAYTVRCTIEPRVTVTEARVLA